MPSFVFPTENKKPIESPVQITDPAYRSKIVDTRYTPEKSIITYVEGSRWIVNYYSQVLGKDDPINGVTPSKQGPYSQLRLVKNLELKVTSELSQSQETTDNAMVVTGTATLYPGLIPNVGDNFVADIGDGRQGIFQITHCERKSIYKDTTYSVEYQLIDFANGDRFAKLEELVVQTLYFVKDFLSYGQSPLVVKEEFEIANLLKDKYNSITDSWLRYFSSNEYKCVLVPKQEKPTYDHYVALAAQRIFTAYDNEVMRYNRVLNCSDDPAMVKYTIWDALADQTLDYFDALVTKTYLTKSVYYARNPLFNGIRYSGIEYVVYPEDGENKVDADYNEVTKPNFIKLASDMVGDDVIGGLPTDPKKHPAYLPNGDKGELPPDIYHCRSHDYYIFSQEFYNRNEVLSSALEIEVMKYLADKAPSAKTLLRIASRYRTWTSLDKYYQGPILLILLNATLRGY